MSITLTDIQFLQSELGQELLLELEHEDLSQQALLALVTRLRKNYDPNQINSAITMAQLRYKAIDKFGDIARQLLFTDDALQQASDAHIRTYRTQNVSGLHVLDVCCGIGTDSIAFAQAGAIVHGIDYDETRIAIARHNADILKLDIRFDCVDANDFLVTDANDLVFFDPARRNNQGQRIYDVEQYIPALSLIKTWQAPRIMVKISPGVDLDQLQSYDATVEFISVEGNLKEAVLHLPKTKTLIATKIDTLGVRQWINHNESVSVALSEPYGWLCEPDATILRAGLVQDVAQSLNGTMLDTTIAYFCTPQNPDSSWVRAWKIREWLPFNLKKLRAKLRAMDIGTLTVKKRGSPITPEELIRKLKLKGKKSATVVLTRYDNAPIAIICDDIHVG
ncbi:MAG: methyltransferase domain-containing protein [Phototrophicaceae bacterium]